MSKMNEPDANPDTTVPVVSGRENQDMTEVRAQVEAERVSRRQALRKFGFGAGLAAIMALSADDLARMAAKKLDQYAGDNKTAHKLAEEFKNAGVAFAGPSYVYVQCPTEATRQQCCKDNAERCQNACITQACKKKCLDLQDTCKNNGSWTPWTGSPN